jgi:LPS sulfotransferase NodH
MKNKDLYVVIGNQRSGTTALRQVFTGSGMIDIGEITQEDFLGDHHRFYDFVDQKCRDNKNNFHPIGHSKIFDEYINYLRDLYDESILIDLKYNALRFLDFASLNEVPVSIQILNNYGAKFVQIIRKNKLRVILSLAMAMKTGIWGIENNKINKDSKIFLEKDLLLNKIKEQYYWDNKVSGWIDNSISIYYEDLFLSEIKKSNIYISELQNFVNSNKYLLDLKSINLKRQNHKNISEYIENFDEIYDILKNGPYFWMIYD